MQHRQWIVCAWLLLSGAAHADSEAAPAVLKVESPYGFEETVNNLRRAIGGSNFRMIREQAWDDGLKSGDHADRDTILYFCNFQMVNQAIKLDSRVGQFLPCRITVAETGGKVLVMTVNPKPLGEALGNTKLTPLCQQITAKYEALIEEAIL